MVRLALHYSDMTATCAIPPGIPTYQTREAFLHVGICGLGLCVLFLPEDTEDQECAHAALQNTLRGE